MDDGIEIRRMAGTELADYIAALARLRIQVFRAFPYLYEGDLDYESRYLATYTDSPDSVIVLAFDGEDVIGAATGLPLADESEDIRQPFEHAGFDVERVFYCGESVLLPAYRGRGIGVRFFEERENHARALGCFDHSCFCAVQRPADHPHRPSNFSPLDQFWRNRDYRPRPELRTIMAWRDLDEETESPKTMMFWLKTLPGEPR